MRNPATTVQREAKVEKYIHLGCFPRYWAVGFSFCSELKERCRRTKDQLDSDLPNPRRILTVQVVAISRFTLTSDSNINRSTLTNNRNINRSALTNNNISRSTLIINSNKDKASITPRNRRSFTTNTTSISRHQL